MSLSPSAKTLLASVYRAGAPRFHELSVAQARRSFDKLLQIFGGGAADVVTEDLLIAGGPEVRLYRPRDTEAAPQAVLVYFHGGGWCVGGIDSYDGLCRNLAQQTGCHVASVGYRLAPEHPFPAAVEDARAAYEWALEWASERFGGTAAVALAGDSAGGNLALVTALSVRAEGRPGPAWLGLVYPCVQIISERASRQAYADGYALDAESLTWFFSRYLPGGQVADWRASPMNASSLEGLPPTLLISAECDPLVDDSIAFVERLQAAGGSVEHLCVAGTIHGFFTLNKCFPEAGAAQSHFAQSLRTALRDR